VVRAVVDTNVIISGIISKKGIPHKILKAASIKKFLLITSEEINKEILKVLRQSHIYKKYKITEQDILFINYVLNETSVMTKGVYKISSILKDKEDEKFLSCALEGNADYIISGDNDLLSIKQYHGIKIITPSGFLKRILTNDR